jgi:hypothetical protein
MGSGDHASFDHVAPPRACGTLPDLAPPPGLSAERPGPRLHALPRPRGRTPRATRGRRLGLPSPPQGVRRHRQPVALLQSRPPPTQPIRTSPLVSTSHPALRQRCTVCLPPLHGPWGSRAVPPGGLGDTGVVPAGLLLGPGCGPGQPPGNPGVAPARHVAQGEGPWRVVDLAQATPPRPRHPSHSRPALGNADQPHTSTPSPGPHGVPTGPAMPCAHGRIVPAAQPMNLWSQAVVPKLLGKRCDVCALHVRQQPTDRGRGMLRECLPLQGGDAGCHTGGHTWQDLVEKFGGALTCLEPLLFANAVAGVQAAAPSGTHACYRTHSRYSYTMS